MEIKFDLLEDPNALEKYFVNFKGVAARVVCNEEGGFQHFWGLRVSDVVKTEGEKVWSGDRIYIPKDALKKRHNKLTIFFLNSISNCKRYGKPSSSLSSRSYLKK